MTINAIDIIPVKTASCPIMGDYAIKKKMNVKWGNHKVGDIVLYDFNNNGTSDHIGLVVGINSNGSIVAIEGNTGSGSNTNGGQVQRRTRTKGNVNYFIRPKYNDKVTAQMVIATAERELGYTESPKGSNKTKYGAWIGANGQPWCCSFISWLYAHIYDGKIEPKDYTLTEDGDWGYATTTTTQHIVGTTEDGEMGSKTWKAIQKQVGLKGKDVDGKEGPTTIKAMQKFVGMTGKDVDGERGKKTNKAWQKWCNSQLKK